MEAQGKALIQQKAELEAAYQVQQQELGALQLEATRLRREIQSLELEREVTNSSRIISGSSPLLLAVAAPSDLSRKESSVWAECGADPDFLASSFEQDDNLPFLPRSSNGEDYERSSDDEKLADMFLVTPTSAYFY